MATKVKAEPKSEALEARYGIEQPYTLTFQVRGITPFLFNRFADLEGYAAEGEVSEKRKPRKKEVRDYEEMVWRTDKGELGVPVQNMIAAIIEAGRWFKSPLSGQGGAGRTLREALTTTDPDAVASFGTKNWDCIDFRLARNGDVKRSPKPTYRPRLEKGWGLEIHLGVLLPEVYGPAKLLEIISRAGTTSGVGDGRKLGFGRFVPDGMEVEEGLLW